MHILLIYPQCPTLTYILHCARSTDWKTRPINSQASCKNLRSFWSLGPYYYYGIINYNITYILWRVLRICLLYTCEIVFRRTDGVRFLRPEGAHNIKYINAHKVSIQDGIKTACVLMVCKHTHTHTRTLGGDVIVIIIIIILQPIEEKSRHFCRHLMQHHIILICVGETVSLQCCAMVWTKSA